MKTVFKASPEVTLDAMEAAGHQHTPYHQYTLGTVREIVGAALAAYGVPTQDGEERLRAVFEAVRSAWERDGSHLSVARAAIAVLEARPREER
jgi:hypothetical protein